MDNFPPFTASTRKGRVAYSLEGDSGPLLAGFHGSPGSTAQILAIMDKMGLAPPRCRRLAVDRPGYNRTPLGPCRKITEQADLFAALLDELNIEAVDVIVAFSGGGIMALEFAARHPQRVKKLLLLSAATRAHPLYSRSRLVKLMFSVPGMNILVGMSYIFPGLAVKGLIAFMSSFSSRQRQQEYRAVCASQEDRNFLLQILRLNYPFGRLHPGLINETHEFLTVNGNYAGLKLPILQVHGRCDSDVDFTHAEDLCKSVESASLLEMKTAYHLIMAGERFNEVKEKILDFCGIPPAEN
ncbi:MAG: alpha/beta hydrolase [Victivallaceae bacterium]|nr:alpha/beta hydrolase [Victivallaceae bacterium]